MTPRLRTRDWGWIAVTLFTACSTRPAAGVARGPSTVVGTYAVEPGPVADGDSSRFELVADSSGTWGRWVRFGNQPVVGLQNVRSVGDTLTFVAGMAAGAAQLRVTIQADSTFTGEWSRGAEHVAFRGRKRDTTVSASMRTIAAIRPWEPGVISTDSGDSFGTLSADGKEFYFTKHRPDWSRHRVVLSRRDGERWSLPETLPFSGEYNDREPKLSPNGRQLFFSSNRPVSRGGERRRDLDIWVAERGSDGRWTAPRHLGAPVNSDAQDFSPVVSGSGTLYFVSTRGAGTSDATRNHNVWRARLLNGRYSAPEKLGPEINSGFETNVYVTPNERLMLVSRDGAPDSFGGDDLYVSELQGGSWTPMRHLDAPINSFEYEYGPLVAPDGGTLFFTSHRRGTADIYRVDIALVGLRPSK